MNGIDEMRHILDIKRHRVLLSYITPSPHLVTTINLTDLNVSPYPT